MENVIWIGFILLLLSFVAIFTNPLVLDKKQELLDDKGIIYRVVRYNLIVGITGLLIAVNFNTTILYIFVLVYIAIHIQYYLYLFFRKQFTLYSIILASVLAIMIVLAILL